jgi:glutamate 5-kinase
MIYKEKDRTACIKVSSNLLTHISKTGQRVIDYETYAKIGRSVGSIAVTHNVIIVTSGAISTGMAKTGDIKRPDKQTQMDELQRLAGIGNRIVNNNWQAAIGEDQNIGNMFITRHDLGEKSPERTEFLRTLKAHFRNGDKVTLNEDDARSHDQITFGDNDILTAEAIAVMKASGDFGENFDVVLLGTVDGIYEDFKDETTKIDEITNIDDYRHLAVESQATDTNGGVASKFYAAETLNSVGIDMFVANGHVENASQLALAGMIGTRFIALGGTSSLA